MKSVICHEVGDRKGRMWLFVASRYAWRSLCSVMAENHQLHGGILAGEVLLCLCNNRYSLLPWSLAQEGEQRRSRPLGNRASSQSSSSPRACVTFTHITVKSRSPAEHGRGDYLLMYWALSPCITLPCSAAASAMKHWDTTDLCPSLCGPREDVSAPRRDLREGQWCWRRRRQTHELSGIMLRFL